MRRLLLRLLSVLRSSWAIDSLRLDIKLGARMLVKYPGLTLVGVFGIATGVAIAAGGFSVIYGNFLVSSLPLEEGDRVVSIELWNATTSKPERRLLHDQQAWREGLKSVREIGAFRTVTANLNAPGAKPESVNVAVMNASGFGVARVRPLMGRYLLEADEREGAPPVVVIGESVWRNRFGRDPAILGRTIRLGAGSHTVVGVMPENFAFPVNHRFWVPLRDGIPSEPLSGPDVMVFGRLAPDATLASARAEFAAVGRRAALALPNTYGQLQPRLLPYAHPFMGLHGEQDETALHTMNGVVTMLLVLVCLNVAILVYTRTAMRQTEISVRAALGASRGRIVAQLFIEALVLAAVGAAAGVGVAEFALRQIAVATVHLAADLPFWLKFHVSIEAVLYAGALSVLAAAIVGIVPALQATRRGVQTGTRIAGGATAGMRLGGTWTALVVAQVGFAVALLPPAVFNAWDTLKAEWVGTGFAAGEFLTAELGLNDLQTPASSTGEFHRRYAARHAQLMRRLREEPRVSGATFAMALPGDERSARIEAAVADPAEPSEAPSDYRVRYNCVDVDFFRALDVPILAGRGFETADVLRSADGAERPASGSVVVNQSFAVRVFGGNALGRRIRYADTSTGAELQGVDTGAWYEVVGIVKDFPEGVSPTMKDSQLRVYHPVAAGEVQPVSIAVRVRGGPPSAFVQPLLDVANAVDSDIHLRNLLSMEEALRKEQWIRRLEAAVFIGVSASVILLSAAGIYALMSFTVSQRRKEIGIRMALGADRTHIVASIFWRALGQLAAGSALGLASATMLEKSSGDELMRGNAAVVLPGVALFMMAVGFLAALGPARRCLGIEPSEALREE